WSDRIGSDSVHLFPVAEAARWRYGSASYGPRTGRFDNPPHGASIYYYLKDKPTGEVKLAILDSQNRVIRRFSSIPRQLDNSADNQDPEDLKKSALAVDPGVQRAVWDLRYEAAKKIK